MSLFDRIFRKQPRANSAAQLVKEPTGAFSIFTGDAYSSDIYRGAIDAIARNISKLKGNHIIMNGDNRQSGDARLNRLLQNRPNPFMTASNWLYKMATHYYTLNNAFSLIMRDERGNVTGIFPVNYSNVEMLTDAGNNLFCKFTFRTGHEAIFPYCDLIHLRRNFNSNELLGDDNSALFPTLEAAQAVNEGITNAIKTAANIRGIVRYSEMMPEEMLKEVKEKFVNNYLTIENNGGVIPLDSKFDFTPVDSKPVLLSAAQQEAIKKAIYDYLGINENIVSSNYTEDCFSSFYESIIEPFAVELGQEMTAKVFTPREIGYGNQIIFESGRLQYASNQTRVALIEKLMPMGLMSINEAREVLNLPGVDGGERRIFSLNYVNAEHADEYQLQGGNKGE